MGGGEQGRYCGRGGGGGGSDAMCRSFTDDGVHAAADGCQATEKKSYNPDEKDSNLVNVASSRPRLRGCQSFATE